MTDGQSLGLSDIWAMLDAEIRNNKYKSGKECPNCGEELWAWKHGTYYGDVIELFCEKCDFIGNL